jgi:hypothetical protein
MRLPLAKNKRLKYLRMSYVTSVMGRALSLAPIQLHARIAKGLDRLLDRKDFLRSAQPVDSVMGKEILFPIPVRPATDMAE